MLLFAVSLQTYPVLPSLLYLPLLLQTRLPACSRLVSLMDLKRQCTQGLTELCKTHRHSLLLQILIVSICSCFNLAPVLIFSQVNILRIGCHRCCMRSQRTQYMPAMLPIGSTVIGADLERGFELAVPPHQLVFRAGQCQR